MAKRFRAVPIPVGVPGRCPDVRLLPTEKLTGVYFFDDFNNSLNLWIEVWDKALVILRSQPIPSGKVVPYTESGIIGWGAISSAVGPYGIFDDLAEDIRSGDDKERILSIWHSDVGTAQTIYLEIDSA